MIKTAIKRTLLIKQITALVICIVFFASCSPSPLAESPAPMPSDGYIKAYCDFLLEYELNDEFDFPMYGYYLFDMNFDGIPELCILHHSGGSMGGYFTYYCLNEGKVEAILDSAGQPARNSDYTHLLADYENKKVYLLKEMYLLRGNENGTYGYVREVINQDGVPYICNVLDLEVNLGNDLEKYEDIDYLYEDEYLSDAALDTCLITRHYIDGGWQEISSEEYLKQKRLLIPENNDFVDLLDNSTAQFPVYTADFNAFRAYGRVLLNKAEFLYTEDNKYVYFNEYLARYNDDNGFV